MVRSRYFMSFIKIPGDGIFNTPALFSNTPGLFSNTLGVLSLCFPIGDIPFLTGETDANFGDGPAVESVLIGVTLVVDLFKGSISGIVVLQLHDIDTLGHAKGDVTAALRARFLSVYIGSKGHKKCVEQQVVVVLVAVVLLQVVRHAGVERLDGLDEGREVVIIAEVVVGIEECGS